MTRPSLRKVEHTVFEYLYLDSCCTHMLYSPDQPFFPGTLHVPWLDAGITKVIGSFGKVLSIWFQRVYGLATSLPLEGSFSASAAYTW